MVANKMKRYVRRARNRIVKPFYKTHRIHFSDGDIAFPLRDSHAYTWFIRYAFRKYNWHEPSITQFMLDLPTDKNIFIDVGAHLGYFSVIFSRRPENTSFAVELDPTNFSLLDQMVHSATGVKGKIEVFNLGISDNDFVAKMPVSNASPFASLGRSDNKDDGTKPVRVTTLDNFCEERRIAPDIIKIDVEGYEWEFLLGGEKVISQHRPILIFEVHTPQLEKKGISVLDFIHRIEDHEYSVFWFPDHRSKTPGKLVPYVYADGHRNFDIICKPNP